MVQSARCCTAGESANFRWPGHREGPMTEIMTVANAPGALPLFGHLGRLLRPWPFLLSLPQYGDLVRIRLGTRPAYVVCSSNLVQQVFADDRTFDRGGPVFDEARSLLGDGLVTCPHTRHRRTRRLVQQVFRANRYPRYAVLMANQVRDAVEHWRDGQVLDVLEDMFTLVAKVSTVTLFSSRLTPVQLDGMYDDVRAITSGWMRRMLTPPILHRVAGGRSFDRSLRRFHETIAETIAHYRRDPTAAPDDVPAILLAAVDDDGSALSDRQVHDEVMTSFFGSMETTAATLAWTLHMLTEYPQVQQRVRDEAQTILRDGPLDWEAVRRLEYTRRVVRETLRLYPPTWLLTRTTRHDTTLGGHSIPADTNIFISPLIQGRDSTAFPDPNRFDPDRRESNDTSTRDTYIAFGLRARRCIGEIFGMTEAVIAIAAITSAWQIHAVPGGTNTTPQVSFVLRPRTLRLRLTATTNRPPLLTTRT
jgi:cytochrome P450